MQTLSFELENSLMDRFIALYLNDSDKGISKWIINGLNKNVNDALLQDRAEWFGRDALDIKWKIDDSKNTQREIREAIYLVFSILGKDAKEERYKTVSSLFNDIVRLSVIQGHSITTYTKYKSCISSADVALQYMLYKLGYVYWHTDDNRQKSLQLKGVACLKLGRNEKPENITFGDVVAFIKDRINNDGVSKLIYRLNKERNDESHAAFYTNPDKYWNRLVYMIYDYIAIAFFLMRYFRGVNDGIIDAVEKEDLKAVTQALKNADALIKEAENINVRFQFVQNETKKEKLSVKAVDEDRTDKKPDKGQNRDKSIPYPSPMTEDGNTYCYYDKTLNRNATYHLQSVEVKNGVDIPCGEKLDLNTNLLFDGAVINLKMPTEDIPYPTIESIIAKSAGLIEDSENRAVIETLLANNIKDDTFRNKLRVILMLDKGDKESIINEFVGKGKDVSEKTPEDFKKFIESKSDGLLKTIEERFDALNNSLQTNQEDLKEFISNAISKIDLSSILVSNAEIKSELLSLNDEMKKWQELQQKIEKQNAHDARKMYECLRNDLEKSNQTIDELCEIFKSQNSQWDEVLSKLVEIGTDVKSLKKIAEDQEEALKKAERKRKIRKIVLASVGALCSIVLALTIWGCYILRTSSNAFIYNSEWRSELAHGWFKNKDVAYERAKYLESKKEYPDAAKWYMLARDRYSDILSKTSSDSIRALRMTQMLMRGKGGSFDTKSAESYAKIAKRFDIEAYLAALNENPQKSRDIINNYQGDTTSYLELADAYSLIQYFNSISCDQIDRSQIDRSWDVVDSLASTNNIATEEALLVASYLTKSGVTDKDGNYILSPSLYDVIAYATDADINFNSMSAQLILASNYECMGLIEDANRYNQKVKDNGGKGWGEVTFSNARIDELDNDPLELLARAHNNAKNGYTDYKMTAYYYHKADSLNSIVLKYYFGGGFFLDWTNFVVKAKDLTTVEQLMPLIKKDYPDSIRLAIADYIMAMKLVNTDNEGDASLDSIKSRDYLLSAASKGLEDAQVAVGLLWDLENIPDGMKILKRLAFRKDNVHPYAARYILSKLIKKNVLNFELLSLLGIDELALTIKLSRMASINDILKFDDNTLKSLRQQINIVLSQQPNFTEFAARYAYLFGKLAEIEYALGRDEFADFYIEVADKLSPKSAYTSMFGFSEIARRNGEFEKALFWAGRFAKLFFLDNGKVLDESNRSSVVEHFYHLYPEILNLVKKDRQHDFTNDNTYFFEQQNFDIDRDFKTYESRVENLQIDIPDYERFTFPITMQYFD